MHEFETEIEVPLRIKVRFSATKAEPMTRHYPGCPAGIDDIEFKIVTSEIVIPLVARTGGGYITRDVEHDVTDGLHDLILESADWDELCFEHLSEIEQDREEARLDSLKARRDFLLNR